MEENIGENIEMQCNGSLLIDMKLDERFERLHLVGAHLLTGKLSVHVSLKKMCVCIIVQLYILWCDNETYAKV